MNQITYDHAKMLVQQCRCASAAWLQRSTRIPYQEADQYLGQMEKEGIVRRTAIGRRVMVTHSSKEQK